MSRRRTLGVAAVLAAVLALAASTASGYVPLTLAVRSGTPVLAHWRGGAFPVKLRVSRGLTSDLPGSDEIESLESAIATWNGGATRELLRLLGEGNVTAGLLDGINAIEFSDAPELELSGAVSLTQMLTRRNGRIREADILVNDRVFGFSVDGGDSGLDLETVLLHELGHLLGLDHSALGAVEPDGTLGEGTAVMFPVTRGPGEAARSLTLDDVAALAAIYRDEGAGRGTVQGRVTRDGEPVFGAHVLAFDPLADALVGALTLPDGTYRLAGLPPGRYVIRAVPLEAPVGTDSFGGIFGLSPLDTGFRATFLPRLVRVRADEVTGGVDVEVS